MSWPMVLGVILLKRWEEDHEILRLTSTTEARGSQEGGRRREKGR